MADRNLVEVIDAMLAVVPEGQGVLVDRLRSVRESAMFAAPEIMVIHWRKAAELLYEEIGPPREDWQRAVADIFSGRRAS